MSSVKSCNHPGFKGVAVDTDENKVPERFAEAFKKIYKRDLSATNAKKKLSEVFEKHMTYDLLSERDPGGEVKGWFDKINALLDKNDGD